MVLKLGQIQTNKERNVTSSVQIFLVIASLLSKKKMLDLVPFFVRDAKFSCGWLRKAFSLKALDAVKLTKVTPVMYLCPEAKQRQSWGPKIPALVFLKVPQIDF